ncbi:MAG: MATE family efflux transporter [Bacteroidales bacterium]|nr:MATE family efflux transporter [Bacteroidales bacterium]
MNKEILKLAIPNIISNITVPLLSMVDLAVMGHLESDIYIGAIALGGIIFNFIYWGFSFLRMSTSGFTSQALGENNKNEIFNIFYRSMFFSLVFGFLLIIFQIPIEKIGFYFLKGTEDVENLAKQYFYIRIYAAPASIGLYSINGWLIGQQNAKTPMFLAILINVLNIFFNIILVFKFNLKSEGVALGTVVSQYIGFFIGIIIIILKYNDIFKHLSLKKILNRTDLLIFFNVNKDIFIRTLFLIFVFSFFTSQSALYGNRILAVNTLLLQFFMLFSYFMDGFAYAAEALTGKYFGAKNFKYLKQIIYKIFIFGFILSILFTAIYYFFDKNILYLLTNNSNIINDAEPYLFWILIIPVAGFASFLWDGIFIGLTASKQMRNSMILSAFIIFFPAFYILKYYFYNNALWSALILFLFSRSISQTVIFNTKIKMKLLHN